MDWQQIVTGSYGSITRILERALADVSTEDLNWQPSPESNSMGWMIWHLTRYQDRTFTELFGGEQLWVKDGWYEKFNRPADPDDTGLGHTAEQVQAFRSPDVDTLMGYQKAVMERIQDIMKDLSETDLNRKLDNERAPNVGARLIGVLGDGMQHAGQVAYLKGLKEALG